MHEIRPNRMSFGARADLLAGLVGFLLVVGLWLPYGLEIFPLNDGWFSLAGTPQFDALRFLVSGAREFRSIPLILAHLSTEHTLLLLNIELIAIDSLIFFGLYMLLLEVFPCRRTEAFICASLGLLFPNDPTMLWLGAFGVNLSWVLLVWASFFSVRGYKRQSKAYIWLGALLVYLGVRTYPGYLAFPCLIMGYHIWTRDLSLRASLRAVWSAMAPMSVALILAVIPVVLAVSDGTSRVGHIAAFDVPGVVSSFAGQAGYLAYGWIAEAADRLGGPFWIWIWAGALAALALSCLWVSEGFGRDLLARLPLRSRPRSVLGLILLSLSLFVFGFMPYSVSDVRGGHDRQLIVARMGLVLLLVYMPSLLVSVRKLRVVRSVIAVVAVPVIMLFVANKAWILRDRVIGAGYQQLFMAQMLHAQPCISPGQAIVIMFTSSDLLERPGGAMLLNRPRYLFHYFYGDGDYLVVGVNGILLRHRHARIVDGRLRYRGHAMSPDTTVGYTYSVRQGLRPMSVLALPDGSNFQLLGEVGGKCELNRHARELLKRQNFLPRPPP